MLGRGQLRSSAVWHRGRPWTTGWLLLSALGGLLVASACTTTSSDDDDDDGSTPATCASACNHIYDCGICVNTVNGCLSQGECTDECLSGLYGGEFATCIQQVLGCSESALNSCLGGGGSGGTGGVGATGGTAGSGGVGGTGPSGGTAGTGGLPVGGSGTGGIAGSA